ncbi:pneumococcal-type histidine triad protein [Streptococcus iniae]|uniref:pneumococcal-type histidine triad protein n=1 Tax=Streptococcus iniae TaxID=1346 RepID=UPI0008DA9C65|nr:pneumococcal-type histidine triad protein [Streptococcus iniae]OHX27057.1 histidine triad (HIT) protein [Streptococcus iniae]RLV28559.1 pneumococcal-type histidine triad protein [Streptococcus iniae]
MKKKSVYLSSVAVLIAANIGCYQLGKHNALTETNKNRIAYIDSKESQSKAKPSGAKTMDQISAEEGISAEQIVVKITEQGYVTSHGDHFHFYNGKVPYDAILSEELLMTDPNYQFKQSDVINEVRDGYVIKVGGNYYVYLKPGSKRKNIRTKAQIEEQVAKGTKEAKEKGIEAVAHLSKAEAAAVKEARASGRYTTDDGYIFSPTDVIDDMGDAFLVPHGNHFHYIPKKDLSASELAAAQAYWNNKSGGKVDFSGKHIFANNQWASGNHLDWTAGTPNYQPVGHLPSAAISGNEYKNKSFGELLDQLHRLDLSKRHVEEDGLIFEPTQVTRANAFGYVIPHGDHFHIIPRWQLSPLEITLAERYLAGQTQGTSMGPVQPIPTTPAPASSEVPDSGVNHQFLGHTIRAYGKGLDGRPYDTSDSYIFTKASISMVDKAGVTAKHGDHFHYMGFGELEQDELNQVEAWLKEHQQDQDIKANLVQIKVGQSLFEPKNVLTKKTENGKVGYLVRENGKEIFYDRNHLDWTQIAFAEQELMLKDTSNYKYDVAKSTIEPRLAVQVSSLPMHAGNATFDTGKEFIIPHIDHIHVVPYLWLNEEQIATIKYVMLHPEARPNIWSNPGHEEVGTVIANSTPKEKRAGLANWQIIHTAEEVQEAIKAGRYATNDGYIFEANDVLTPGTRVWSDNSFSIPRPGGESMRNISKDQLSDAEWQKVQEVLASKKASATPPKAVETLETDQENADKERPLATETQTEPASEDKAEDSLDDVSGEEKAEGSNPFGMDQASFKANLAAIASKAGLQVNQLIVNASGVQHYDQNGDLVTYDIHTMQKK